MPRTLSSQTQLYQIPSFQVLEIPFTLLNYLLHLAAACSNYSLWNIEILVLLNLDLVSAGEFALMGLDVLFFFRIVGRVIALRFLLVR